MDKDDKKSVGNVQNYIRLQNLLMSIALPLLRKQFVSNWETKYQREWSNSEIQGTEFISDVLFANLFKEAGKIQKNLLKTGDIMKWDLPLVIEALKCFPSSKEQKSSFSTLKEVRNKLSHHGRLEIENEMFEKTWKSTSEALINLGVSQDDLDKAKTVFGQESVLNIEKAEKLKDEGNVHVKNNRFGLAVSKYTEAIYQPGLPSKELAILYSNRSFAHLKQGDYYSAKEDARGAIQLNPNWWRGFGRLGHAYLSVDKYEQALDNFNEAIRLDPACKLQNERDFCLHKIEKLRRQEHLDPISHYTTADQMASKFKDDPFLASVMGATRGSNCNIDLPIGMCGEGHKYFVGNGVPQNYEMAAHWYSKAAAQGSAEGFYNLALLTREGKGVQMNVAESIRLLEVAASQDIYMDVKGVKMPNIGVMEAEHSLGLSYQDGIGVRKDYRKALDWYTKAIRHGSGVSANNVGYMYLNGEGVPLNGRTALNYFKLGSSMKVVRAMENVADVYLNSCDKENARKWFQYAMSRGSLALQSKRDDYLNLVGKGLNSPFEDDVFELELLEEVKSGPLAHLIAEKPQSPEEMLQTLMQKISLKRSIGETTSRALLGLTDPYRIGIIKDHRTSLRMMRDMKLTYDKGEGKLLPKPMVDLFTLKPIHFADMDPKKDHIYEGYAIKLTLIEDAVTGRPSISQIAEDENGDAQRIFIYNFPQDHNTQNAIGFGCKITVVNPYFRLAKDGRPMIRVDDIALMFLHSNIANKKRCRYCGKESDSTVPCRLCKRSFYCSKVCLKKDSLDMNHNAVCIKRI